MRIVHLTPGTGNFHCGSCLRDNVLIKELRARGHDAVMVPLYLPLVTDDAPASPELPVMVGGISLFLSQKLPWLRLPGWVRGILDSPARLMKAANQMGMTSPKDLGEMTLGSFRGLDGPQAGEWERLIAWMESEARPDVISLSNGLLCGLAGGLKERFGVPVVCSLQGEDSFLDTLEEPWRERAWAAFRERAGEVDQFVAASGYYAGVMRERLGLGEERVRVVPNGMDFRSYEAVEEAVGEPVIGYLARMCHGKGLSTLVDAFLRIREGGKVPGVRLRIAGARTRVDDAYIAGLEAKIREAGAEGVVEWLPNISFEEKIAFLRSLRVFSVPATYGEAFGLFVIEALACGVPVVQPRHGGFPEILEKTGGGILCEADDVGSLCEGLEKVLSDDSLHEWYRKEGSDRVREVFHQGVMAEAFEGVLGEIC